MAGASNPVERVITWTMLVVRGGWVVRPWAERLHRRVAKWRQEVPEMAAPMQIEIP